MDESSKGRAVSCQGHAEVLNHHMDLIPARSQPSFKSTVTRCQNKRLQNRIVPSTVTGHAFPCCIKKKNIKTYAMCNLKPVPNFRQYSASGIISFSFITETASRPFSTMTLMTLTFNAMTLVCTQSCTC
jgi:hypothetical protein